VLLAGGADVEARAANRMTAWEVARREEVIRVLREARGKVYGPVQHDGMMTGTR
jgi:hypothetical protein